MKKKLYTLSLTFWCEIIRLLYFITIPLFKKRNIWLICETEFQAQENGYYLFKYIRENYPDRDVYYVISKESPCLHNIDYLDNVLYLNSFKQIFYMFHASKIISTHGLWMNPDELGIFRKLTKKMLKSKKVMLNHGIGLMKNGKKYYHKNIFALNDLFIAISDLHKSIFVNEYGYKDEEVIIAGYPRFDDLIDTSTKKSILFMPTWRDGQDNLGNHFKETDFFKEIEKLLTSYRLENFLKKNGILFNVYLHQNFQKYNEIFKKFETENIKIIRQGEKTVQDLLKENKCLITDYSSVLFDFVYMKKPFISYQFDRKEFLNSRKDNPFIDITRDIPGDIVDNLDDLINVLEELNKSEFKIKPKHLKESERFFKYRDQNNCKRVYKAIETI
ncbi:CDP-glycerol glycerophosphotransferase family protein [uncultured Ilyobacter sp.]|uniref:CDP-glycerol glycerophosphotransferase family protein n=1 Tax=uncultured Ilyobacter sp. TaxID=544433 RepID=UPI0029F5A830|nr:CDP-glycerol glycerophosphotransferase family protein [uncultured Ilyobacter sp.]